MQTGIWNLKVYTQFSQEFDNRENRIMIHAADLYFRS